MEKIGKIPKNCLKNNKKMENTIFNISNIFYKLFRIFAIFKNKFSLSANTKSLYKNYPFLKKLFQLPTDSYILKKKNFSFTTKMGGKNE